MTELDRALVEIKSIRRQVARTTEFRGYGPLTLSSTAALALVAGGVQWRWVAAPQDHPLTYVALWLMTAVLCAALIATQMLIRAGRLHLGMADEMVLVAVTNFLPAAIAGGCLPFVLLPAHANVLWMLPGLWQVFTGVGIFASSRSMPRPMLAVGGWFLLTGFVCLALGDDRALSPVTMAGAYGVGMALVATIHFFAAKDSIDEEK